MNKIINFVNRTKEQILQFFALLRERYRKVRFVYFYYNGFCQGWFEVENRIKRQKYENYSNYYYTL